MVHNTTEDIQGYCYCQLANQASHYVQVELQTLAGDAPFWRGLLAKLQIKNTI